MPTKSMADVIILGTGAMGSAAAYHLARKNIKVLGIDRFLPPHKMGSSHGESRIIREAYFEGPYYVPIVQLAYKNWEKLEKEYGHPLYLPTGGLMIGYPGSNIIQGSRLSADRHSLPYEYLRAKELQQLYPSFHLAEDMAAVKEPRAGILYPEKCISAHIDMARQYGARFLFNETAISWQTDGSRICVTTPSGKWYADRLVITAGAWINQFLPGNRLPLSVERQVLYWFKPVKKYASFFEPEYFPVFIWSVNNENDFYGFPDLGNGIKIARHHRGEPTSPDILNRNVSQHEIDDIRQFISQYIPGANGELLTTEVCMYTNTPDHNFYLSPHPHYPQVLIASICSGHGFKFSSAMGEIISDILTSGKTNFDISHFGYTA